MRRFRRFPAGARLPREPPPGGEHSEEAHGQPARGRGLRAPKILGSADADRAPRPRRSDRRIQTRLLEDRGLRILRFRLRDHAPTARWRRRPRGSASGVRRAARYAGLHEHRDRDWRGRLPVRRARDLSDWPAVRDAGRLRDHGAVGLRRARAVPRDHRPSRVGRCLARSANRARRSRRADGSPSATNQGAPRRRRPGNGLSLVGVAPGVSGDAAREAPQSDPDLSRYLARRPLRLERVRGARHTTTRGALSKGSGLPNSRSRRTRRHRRRT